MNETEWTYSVQQMLSKYLKKHDKNLAVSQGTNLPYAYEILSYEGSSPKQSNTTPYETDLLVFEKLEENRWKPRVVIECKLETVTTHDAITYSEKAFTHKRVHPYLRYGIMLGNRKHYPLPGRLFRHGAYFDFMLSWVSSAPTKSEFKSSLELLLDEVDASRKLEEILYESRHRGREKYTLLHKPLRLK